MCFIDLSLCSLAESLAHLLQKDFLSSRVAIDDRLRPLSASLTVAMKMLQDRHMQLSDAAKQNAQTHALLEAAHLLLHRYQVNTHTHTWLLLKKLFNS